MILIRALLPDLRRLLTIKPEAEDIIARSDGRDAEVVDDTPVAELSPGDEVVLRVVRQRPAPSHRIVRGGESGAETERERERERDVTAYVN